MKIGIIGSGVVGKALAAGFTKHGYEIMVGSRQPQKLDDWKTEISANLQTGDFSETASFGDVVVLATKGTAAEEAVKLAGIDNLSGKTVFDATNPIADAEPINGVLKFTTSLDNSLMEQLQKLAPKANFVKAFNSVGNAFMVDPPFESKPTMFICGNSDNAKQEATKILHQFGWEVEDMGMVEAARAIEPLCILWCIPGFRENRWTHAFKLLKL
jgi:predicted dinucleotide-binding enzyme